MSRFFKGPLGGSREAWGGAGQDVPMQALNKDEWVVYDNDFQSTQLDYDATNDWLLTPITAGSAAIAETNNGILRLDCPANQQGPIIQHTRAGTAVQITPTVSSATAVPSDAVFMARFALLDWGQSSFFMGFAEITSTSTVMSGAGAITSDTCAGFYQTDPATAGSSSAVSIIASGDDDTDIDNPDQVIDNLTMANGGYLHVAIRITGTTAARFYYRRAGLAPDTQDPHPWTQVQNTASDDNSFTVPSAWDSTMFPTFALAGSAIGDDLDIDRLVVAVKRDLTI